MIISKFRYVIRKPLSGTYSKHFSTSNLRFDKDDPGSGGSNKSKAAQKLDTLLKSIIKEDVTEKEVKVQIPKPKQNFKKAIQTKPKYDKKSLGERIVKAVTEVSKVVEGERKETEIQLLQKLLYKESPLGKEITKAYASSANLNEVIAGMKVEKEEGKAPGEGMAPRPGRAPAATGVGRAAQVRSALGPRQEDFRKPRKSPSSSKGTVDIADLFGAKPLGIFTSRPVEGSGARLATWERCSERELSLAVTHPPANIYEQMIQWTEKGALWTFPIDNEQGLESEKETPFFEHVFLETHLEGWCPTSGPVRHFMELVCVGLSKNHWMTAAEKRAHLDWYRDYFASKGDVLKELGAGQVGAPATQQPPAANG